MPLVNTKEMFEKALIGKYAIGAFNVENMEMMQAVIEVASELNSPVIIQTTSSTLKYAPPRVFASMLKALLYEKSINVALNLDHGDSIDLCKECISSGYTSIMMDGSRMSFDENINICSTAVRLANKNGISIETELGAVGGKEDNVVVEKNIYTDPNEAERFVELTGTHSLAVAIGTAHGFYKGEPNLDFNRLSEISSKVNIPLVLHGASGVPDSQIRKAINLGVTKVNFATELRYAYTEGVKDYFKTDPAVYDPKKYNSLAIKYVKEVVRKKIILCQNK